VTHPEHDPPGMVDAFQGGDESALADLYARWSPLVYTVALRTLGNVGDAEAATQQVFARAWSSRATFDPTRSRLPIWLIQITRRAVADLRQTSSGSAPNHPAGGPETAADHDVDPADLAGRLLLADELSRLEPAPQQALRMALYDNVTHHQIAERMGLAPSIVKSQILRSLLILRQRLKVPSDAY
jgi:RNA polymerase sigma factor (sigma-70 family)